MRTPRFFAALVALVVSASATGGASDESILARVRGSVAYAPASATSPRPLVASIVVSDETRALTEARAAAQLTLPDSSIIQIGDRSDVRVSAFRAAAREGAGTTIVLNRGAVRFDIRRPQGGKSNYVFVTPTGQMAVRGTLAYLVVGPAGDQIYCVTCAAGDVEYTTPFENYGVQSGQTLNVRRVGRAVDARIVPNVTVNNPAIDQFLAGFSPFGRPKGEGSDPTGSGSGAS